MATTPPNGAPDLEHTDWPASLTDQELDRALDRLLAEITVRKGATAAAHVSDAVMRRFM